MTLVMTLLVRDEEDIVDATVRFHLERGVDLLLVTDNLSLDRTRDLLADYERQGAAQVWSEPNDEYRQWEWVSRMAQVAATRYNADWVLHCDADEFWWTDRPLPEVLAAVPAAYDVVTAPRHDFLPIEPRSDVPFMERMTVRDTDSHNILGRPLMAKCAHRARDDVIVAQGNHFVVNQGMKQMPELLDATILHFPVRSHVQLERKVVLGGRAYARNPDMPETVGNTWRMLYRYYLDGTLDAYIDGLVPDNPTMAERLASGRYVVDTRLRDLFDGRVQLPLRSIDPGPADATARAVHRIAAEVESCRQEPGAVLVGDAVEQRLISFLDGACTSLDVVASDVSATGVLAALASARLRKVDLRLLTGNLVPALGWRLDDVAGRVAGDAWPALVIRDGAAVWSGPASLGREGLHAPGAAAVACRHAEGMDTLIRRVDALWAQASRAADDLPEAVAAGG
jgi:hypothetical protein